MWDIVSGGGDTIGYRKNDAGKWVASDGSIDNFEFSADSAKTYGKDIAWLKSGGYIDGTLSDCLLRPEFDAASAHLGSGCRMPTCSEISSLSHINCTKQWTVQNGCWGYKVNGHGACSSKSIFLPVTSDETGMYWSSQIGYAQYTGSIYGNCTYTDYGSDLTFTQTKFGGSHVEDYGMRRHGIVRFAACSVRPVVDFLK